MNEDEKRLAFAIMSHAEDLQKIADESHKELRAVTAALKDAVKLLPAEASGAVSGAMSSIIDFRLVAPLEKAGADLSRIVAAVKAETKGLWRYPAAILAFFMLAMGGIAYLGVQWLKDERYELKEEISALNHELAQTANVSTINGKDGYWVEIDAARDILKTTDGKTFAKMPRR